MAAEVSAKKKAEREQRKAEREEQRESEDDDREARRAARKAARAEKAERETEEARAAVCTNFRHCIGESELRSVCIIMLKPVFVVRRQRRRKRPVSGRSESVRRNGERRWRRRSRLR